MTARADRTARLWAPADRVERGQFEHPAGVRAVVFSPDGRFVVTGCGDRLVRVWDAATGQLRLRAGRPGEAVEQFEGKLYEPRAWDVLFRAVAYRRLNRHDQADAWVTRAKVWIAGVDRVAADPAAWAWDPNRWDDWTDRVVVAALLREAAPGK